MTLLLYGYQVLFLAIVIARTHCEGLHECAFANLLMSSGRRAGAGGEFSA
jgi:hypothetical protein